MCRESCTVSGLPRQLPLACFIRQIQAILPKCSETCCRSRRYALSVSHLRRFLLPSVTGEIPDRNSRNTGITEPNSDRLFRVKHRERAGAISCPSSAPGVTKRTRCLRWRATCRIERHTRAGHVGSELRNEPGIPAINIGPEFHAAICIGESRPIKDIDRKRFL
jgi:hypothetical protein